MNSQETKEKEKEKGTSKSENSLFSLAEKRQ
jgi:hypothetical protein